MNRQTLIAVILVTGVSRAAGQADLTYSYTSDKQPLEDKALFIADALVKHPDLFRKLLKIFNAGESLLDIGSGDPNVEFVKEYFLDNLPELITYSDSAGIIDIITNELYLVNISDVIESFQRRNLSVSSPGAKQELTEAIWSRYDKIRALRRVLSYRSVRSYLPLMSSDGISGTCYNDMTDFIDTIPGVQYPPSENLNYTTPSWTIQMLDSYGKPPSGILEGNLNWPGSAEECHKIHAHIDAGVLLGNRSLTSPVDFSGRYCTVTFNLSANIVSFTGKENLDSLTLGVCVPDTCSSHDVSQLFQLGILKTLNMIPTSVSCPAEEKQSTIKPYATSNWIFQQFNTCAGIEGSLNRTQWQICILEVLDTNQDGYVSKKEWLILDRRPTNAQFFLQMDINKNMKIDKTDVDYIFNFIDKDGNGKIDHLEFAINWKSLIWPFSLSAKEDTGSLATSPVLYQQFTSCDTTGKGLTQQKWIQCFFSHFDVKNKNGGIGNVDWSTIDSRKDSARNFLLTDINKDGQIDSTDLTHLFSLYDDNNDGRITLQEFTWNWKSTMWY